MALVKESTDSADNNMAGVTRKLCKQLQRVALSMPRAKTTGGFGAWGCVWWLSVQPYAGEAPC